MSRENLFAEALRISGDAWSALLPEHARAAEAKPYYDAEADRVARQKFYAGFALPGDPRDAFGKLHDLVTSDFHGHPYDVAKKRLHTWIDLHENDRLRSIYSGKEVDPKKLLEAEERIAALYAASGKQPPYNCEHVVPSAWFAHELPMRGDLHHLFTCETLCNGYRNDYSFFDFAKDTPTKPDCGQLDKPANKFEPAHGKGPVARATLYFIVKYPQRVDDPREYDMARIEMLKKWHFASRPEAWEKRRNLTIQQFQGNRNPFIDEPEWVNRIDFRLGLKSSVPSQRFRCAHAACDAAEDQQRDDVRQGEHEVERNAL